MTIRPGVHPHGFTLIEVLATMAVIAIVLPVAMYGISLGVHTAEIAKQKAEASTLAQSKLSELLATIQTTSSSSNSSSTGDFQVEGHPEYHWQAAMSTRDDIGCEQIDLTVSWHVAWKNSDQDLTLSTWVYLANGGTP